MVRIFLLKINGPIDTSIHELEGGWTAEVVAMVSDPESRFHRPGNGLDFYQKDVRRIVDESNGELIYDSQFSIIPRP